MEEIGSTSGDTLGRKVVSPCTCSLLSWHHPHETKHIIYGGFRGMVQIAIWTVAQPRVGLEAFDFFSRLGRQSGD